MLVDPDLKKGEDLPLYLMVQWHMQWQMWVSQWLCIPNVTESRSQNHQTAQRRVCASLLTDPHLLPSAQLKQQRPWPAWFHSADPPSLPLESMMDWFETKPSRSQTERFLFTFGNNLKPLEKIMCQLCINSFTTRYKGSCNSGVLCLIEFICFHFVNREERESIVVDSWYNAASIPGQMKGWPCRFTPSEPGLIGVKNHKKVLLWKGGQPCSRLRHLLPEP